MLPSVLQYLEMFVVDNSLAHSMTQVLPQPIHMSKTGRNTQVLL